MDELLLLSGNDLPFPEARLTVHQPRLKEIAYITEQRFWHGCEFLNFNKELLPNQDKVDLSNMSNFNIIMTIIQERSLESQQARLNVMSVLALLFPTNEILLGKQVIQIREPQTNEVGEINQDNFEAFKRILTSMFCLTNSENKEYNPSGQLARKIADKIKKGREQRAKLAPETKMDYTVYQLMDEFNRYQLKINYDAWERYRVAGATGMSDPEDWFKDIHEENNKK